MKTIVLVILALVAAVFAQLPAGVKEGQTFTVAPEVVKDPEQVGNSFKAEECAQIREVTCQYLKKCSKLSGEVECLKWEKFNVCVQEKVEEYKETKEICAQYETPDRFQPEKCLKCLRKGTEEVPAKRTVCAKQEEQQRCVQRGTRPLCAEYQLVKHCYEVTPPYNVEGPNTCPAGQELQFTLINTGANEKPRLVRTCRNKVTVTKTQCSGVLDPHMQDTQRRPFEFQHAGDFKFMITSDGSFECHVRLQHITANRYWTGPTAFACRVNGIDVFVWDQNSFRLNGHNLVLNVNAPHNLPNGGQLLLENAGKRVRVVGANRAEFFLDIYGPYANGNVQTLSGNFYGLVPSDLGVTGICAGGDANVINYWLKDRAYGLFPFTYEARILGTAFPTPVFTEQDRKNAEAQCLPIFDPKFRKLEFDNCVSDLLNTNFVNKEATLAAEKDAALLKPNK